MNVKTIRTTCDTRGRIYLKEALRSKFGETFLVVESGDGLLLLPVPDDPVGDLARMGRSLRRMSTTDIRKRVARRASDEVRG